MKRHTCTAAEEASIIMKRHTCTDALLTLRDAKRHRCNDASQNPRSVVNNSKWCLKREEAREEASSVNIRQGLARKPQTTSSVPSFSYCCCCFPYRSFSYQVPFAAATRKYFVFALCVLAYIIHQHSDTTYHSKPQLVQKDKSKYAYLETNQKSKL